MAAAPSFAVVSLRLPSSDAPIVGVPLTPYALARRGDGAGPPSALDDSVPDADAAPAGARGGALRVRWWRAGVGRGAAVCWAHPEKAATIQCVPCLRSARGDAARTSYHCGPECLKAHWPFHKELHETKRPNGDTTTTTNGYSMGDAGGGGGAPPSASKGGLAPSASAATLSGGADGGGWVEIGRGRSYTPTAEDVGASLRVEVVGVELGSGPYPTETGRPMAVTTARVRPAPSPPRRALTPLPPGCAPPPSPASPRFTVLTYNLLADLYATPDQFGGTPPWALAWPYRRQNLIKELVAYGADVVCLQEVQSTHFADFLAPELHRAGYAGVYKKKTADVFTGASYAADGCATFFKRSAFGLVKKYEVEFNKAALSLSDAIPVDRRQAALNRLLKDNVALIAVLEALDPATGAPLPRGGGGAGAGGRALVCVANTHIHANPDLSDVKLWQVHTLLKGLEKIAASAAIPMVVAGDFNSAPGSAAHALLVARSVDGAHPDLANDPLGILRPSTKLAHGLPLASAYAAAAAIPPGGGAGGPAAARLRAGVDAEGSREPRFTNAGRDFKGTLDYVLYSADALTPTALLELPDEADLLPGAGVRGGGGLPSERWSSDHVALMAEFAYRAR